MTEGHLLWLCYWNYVRNKQYLTVQMKPFQRGRSMGLTFYWKLLSEAQRHLTEDGRSLSLSWLLWIFVCVFPHYCTELDLDPNPAYSSTGRLYCLNGMQALTDRSRCVFLLSSRHATAPSWVWLTSGCHAVSIFGMQLEIYSYRVLIIIRFVSWAHICGKWLNGTPGHVTVRLLWRRLGACTGPEDL